MTPIPRSAIAIVCLALAAPAPPATAQAGIEDAVVVSATRSERRSFDIPVSIDAVGAEAIKDGQPQVNLSEALQRIPGVVVQNRQNYAQDLQISIRGSGARASFGVRGVKLYADGIPATMPDGQGQAANFSLSSAKRIEVMRGPVAALYGNASGGVIQLFTEDGPQQPTLSGDLLLGSYGTRRIGAKFGGESGALNYIADWSRFRTGGYRAHSSTEREQFNGKLKWAAGGDTRLSLVLNALDQPETRDPLGLTRAQVAADPRQADAVATTFNTRKSVRQTQAGLTLEHRLGATDRLRASAYVGERTVRQFLAFTGSGATSSGGVVDLDRYFGGLNLNWMHDGALLGRPFSLTAGVEYELMQDRRKGFVNNSGAMGALRRDEDNRVSSNNLFAQADWRFTERASVTAGLRSTRVAFDSRDFYIVGVNPDDSGAAKFSNASPVAGLTFRLTPELNLYAAVGRGFETPTFAELAYRSSGAPGLNFALKPARSGNAEIGLKGRISDYQRLSVARFESTTRDEIVVDTSIGGRTTFKNASRTKRSGWEASWQAVLPAGLDAQLAWTLLDARFAESFTSGTPAVTVPAGNRIPGVPRSSLYAELRWRHVASGFSSALEARRNAKVHVDDRNSDSATAYTVVNLRAGFEQKARGWRLAQTLRIDNLGNRNYVGSVIVAEANGRFFEPAPRRNVALIVSGSMQF